VRFFVSTFRQARSRSLRSRGDAAASDFSPFTQSSIYARRGFSFHSYVHFKETVSGSSCNFPRDHAAQPMEFLRVQRGLISLVTAICLRTQFYCHWVAEAAFNLPLKVAGQVWAKK
jgi:hypothetical protein